MRIYKVLSWLIAIVSAALFIYLLGLSYDACIVLISKISGYSKTERIAGLLTPAKFALLKFAPLAGIVLGILLLVFTRPITKCLQIVGRYFKAAWEYLIQQFVDFPKGEKIAFVTTVIANIIVKLYYLLNFPITYDEAWTFLNFTDRSIISSVTYYSAPNNHIFNSVLTNIFNHLPLPVTVRLRIPAFIAGILFLIVFYIFSRRWLGHKVAVLLLLILSFLTPQLFYSFAARGYIFVLLFATICYFISIRLTETITNESRNLFYFSVCSVLGFYTMPSFLYPYATLNIYLLAFAIINGRKTLLSSLIIWGVVTVLGVIILYSPVLAISGIASIVANQYVVPISRNEVLDRLPQHLLEAYKYLFVYKYTLFILFPLLILTSFIVRYKPIALLNLWMVAFMIAIPILHSVVPFERTWIYVTIPVLISLGLIIQIIAPVKLPVSVYYILGAAASVIILVASNAALRGIEDYALQANDATDFAWNKKMKAVYVKEPLMDTYLLYKFKTNKATLNCIIFEKDYYAAQQSIEYLLIRKHWQSPVQVGEPEFSNGYFDIYKNPSYINSIKP